MSAGCSGPPCASLGIRDCRRLRHRPNQYRPSAVGDGDAVAAGAIHRHSARDLEHVPRSKPQPARDWALGVEGFDQRVYTLQPNCSCSRIGGCESLCCKAMGRPMAQDPRVAIVGGGIGGLTAAVAMHRHGIDVKVYEQSLQITEIGAGVSLSPNAIKALRALGLAVPIAEIGFESDHQLVRTWNTGDIVSKVFRKGVYEKEFGAPYLSMHRADLVDVLRRQLPEGVFRLGMQCVRAEADESKGRVYFADGSVEEADIVVGADGIRSAIRRSLFGDESPRFTG